MKISLLLGAALLCAPAIATAQDAPPPPNDMSAQQMPQATPPADPNATAPTGAVPADSGMTPADPTALQDASAPVGSSANPAVVGGNATPAPEAKTDYPVCSKTVQDSCINRGEAHKGKKASRHKR